MGVSFINGRSLVLRGGGVSKEKRVCVYIERGGDRRDIEGKERLSESSWGLRDDMM
jgi:hypothetical protein